MTDDVEIIVGNTTLRMDLESYYELKFIITENHTFNAGVLVISGYGTIHETQAWIGPETEYSVNVPDSASAVQPRLPRKVTWFYEDELFDIRKKELTAVARISDCVILEGE